MGKRKEETDSEGWMKVFRPNPPKVLLKISSLTQGFVRLMGRKTAPLNAFKGAGFGPINGAKNSPFKNAAKLLHRTHLWVFYGAQVGGDKYK